MTSNRTIELDIFKGWAIVFMVLYHIFYDLNYFKYISIDMHRDSFWIYSRHLILTMFLLAVGMGLSLTHTSQIKWDKIRKRIVFLGGASLIVTVVTYIVFPQTWVYFGILHFILFASLVGLLFLPYPSFSLILAISILIGSKMGWLDMHWLFIFLEDFLHLPRYAEDLVPFLPWFAVVLMGMALTSYGYHKNVLQNSLFSPRFTHNKILASLGRNALLIYLIHQPLFFAFFLFIDFIVKI